MAVHTECPQNKFFANTVVSLFIAFAAAIGGSYAYASINRNTSSFENKDLSQKVDDNKEKNLKEHAEIMKEIEQSNKEVIQRIVKLETLILQMRDMRMP